MRLEEALIERFRHGVTESLPEEEWEGLALRVFAHQFAHNRPYQAYCAARGQTPDRIASWREIPALPTAAFKEVPLCTVPPEDAAIYFETSGTTAGGRSGRHYMRTTALYDAALLPPFAAHVMWGEPRIRMLSLGPSPRLSPHSSLGYMLGRVTEAFGAAGSAEFATPAGVDTSGLAHALQQAILDGEPVCLLGTAFAFVHALEQLSPSRFPLPAGSRLMDTGGYKGRSREVPREELLHLYEEVFAIPASHVISEYGMTEMSSQFYGRCAPGAGRWAVRRAQRASMPAGLGTDCRSTEAPPQPGSPAFTQSPAPSAQRCLYVAPPWVRTVVVDPERLEPLPSGQTEGPLPVGLLRHYDLANLDSVMAIQTDDLGIARDGGFELLGRAAGAEARGCSLAVEELLRQQATR